MIKQQIDQDLKAAMLAGDKPLVSTTKRLSAYCRKKPKSVKKPLICTAKVAMMSAKLLSYMKKKSLANTCRLA
jgi:uncharacterized protein YqeY